MVLFWSYDSVDVIIRSCTCRSITFRNTSGIFYNWNLIKGNKDFVGLGNYTKLLGDETFIHSVVFTLILAVISILMSNLIGFVIAYFLDSNVRCKGVIRSLFLFLILSVV